MRGRLGKRLIQLAACILAVHGLGAEGRAAEVEIRVDAERRHQAYEGFGATTMSLVHEGTSGDMLGPKLRPLVLDAVYNQVKLTMGNLSVGLLV